MHAPLRVASPSLLSDPLSFVAGKFWRFTKRYHACVISLQHMLARQRPTVGSIGDSGTAKTVQANVTGRGMSQKNLRTNQGGKCGVGQLVMTRSAAALWQVPGPLSSVDGSGRFRRPELWVNLFWGGGRQLRRSAMWDAVILVWTATIFAYAIIAVAFIIGRGTFNRISQVWKHEGLLHSAQDQPQ
jgi:hypothetical protein